MQVIRLQPQHVALARETFAMMGEVFAEDDWVPLDTGYLTALLERSGLWLYAAIEDDRPVGGLTAHELPVTRAEETEVLIYDLAVREDRQRRGIGRALVQRLLTDAAAAGIREAWVPADDEDLHALEFYRRTGGSPRAVTIFTYSAVTGTEPAATSR